MKMKIGNNFWGKMAVVTCYGHKRPILATHVSSGVALVKQLGQLSQTEQIRSVKFKKHINICTIVYISVPPPIKIRYATACNFDSSSCTLIRLIHPTLIPTN